MNKLQIISLLVAGIPAWGAGGTYNVADYGAHNDGSALSTEAFRAAIHAAGAAGGGTVYVPAGHYVTGPIELVSNLVLRFDAGAVVRFPAMRLPFTAGRQQGVECLTPVPLIGGRNLENVTITGRGQLTTDQSEWLALMGRPQFRSETSAGAEFGPAWNRLLELLELKKPVAEAVYREVAPFLRPSFIRFMDSRNVLVDGLHISGSPMWAIHLLYADHAVVRNVIIETYPGAETDGIVVDSSRNVEIADSYFDTGDDAVVLKSGKDADGLRVNRPTENIAITNCTFHRAHGAVTLGSETSGWIRNVVAGNITCNGTQMGIRIKSRRGRGGGVEHVRFNNWTMENVGQGINVTNYYVMAGEARTGGGAGDGEDAGVSRYCHQPCDDGESPRSHRCRGLAGNADLRPAHLRCRGFLKNRREGLPHSRLGTARCSSGRRSEKRSCLSHPRLPGTGVGWCLVAPAGCGFSRRPS